MRAVVQRVLKAAVTVEGSPVGEINKGLLILIGIGLEDDETDIDYLSEKIANLRIFEDSGACPEPFDFAQDKLRRRSKMNLSILDVAGGVLVISQFTLFGDCRKGRRPSFDLAAPPEKAEELYNLFVHLLKTSGCQVQTGIFQARMEIDSLMDGPVTILLDSKRAF